MTVSATSSTTTNVLSVLAQASTSTAQLSVTREEGLIVNDIQNRLSAQIAAIEPPSDDAVSNALQAQLSSLESQRSKMSALSPQYGANANVLSQLQTQLANLQTAASNGDSAGFDTALSQANLYLSDLAVINPPAPLQADGIAGLKGSGLGIASSAQYDLSTPSGQTAAEAAVSAAQNTVGIVFGVTTANQLLAGDISTALGTQITQIETQQQQQESSSQSSVQAQIQQLTEQAQNQEHLIQLALGNTTTLASSIFASVDPPTAASSPLQVLQDQVGATAASSTAASNATPAILSLLS